MSNLENYTNEHQMEINTKKTKVILFNPHKSLDFLPKIEVNGAVLEVVEEVKLLGIIITSDLKWKSNTKNLVTRANARLWMLRRLARLGTPEVELIDTYCKQIRSVLELAVPVWHPGLTLQESNDIETVQKSSFHIILGKDYMSTIMPGKSYRWSP